MSETTTTSGAPEVDENARSMTTPQKPTREADLFARLDKLKQGRHSGNVLVTITFSQGGVRDFALCQLTKI